MEALLVPGPLQAKLGHDASEGLVQMFSIHHERYERRLTEEVSAVRVEMHQGFAGLRGEMHQGLAALRGEMHQGLAALRGEMHHGFAAVRQEMAAMRVEWIKWSFLFWIGHLAITMSVMAFMFGGR